MNPDELLRDVFVRHEHLAPEANSVLDDIRLQLDAPPTRKPRRALAAVGAASLVAAIAVAVTVLSGNSKPTHTAPATAPTPKLSSNCLNNFALHSLTARKSKFNASDGTVSLAISMQYVGTGECMISSSGPTMTFFGPAGRNLGTMYDTSLVGHIPESFAVVPGDVVAFTALWDGLCPQGGIGNYRAQVNLGSIGLLTDTQAGPVFPLGRITPPKCSVGQPDAVSLAVSAGPRITSNGSTSKLSDVTILEKLTNLSGIATHNPYNPIVSAQAVGTTDKQAELATGDGSGTEQEVWLIQVEYKNETVCDQCSAPSGAQLPRGRYVVNIYDARTFESTTFGISNRPIDLAKLGKVITLHG